MFEIGDKVEIIRPETDSRLECKSLRLQYVGKICEVSHVETGFYNTYYFVTDTLTNERISNFFTSDWLKLVIEPVTDLREVYGDAFI